MKSILVLSAALLVLTGAPRTAAAQDTTQTARFVPDVVAQFNALTQRADAMGFELYGPDPSQCRHMQSIVRVDAADGTPYFLVSRSTQEPGVNPFCEGGSKQSNIYIVRMGSRDKSGERLRSNRLRRFMETTDTPPDPEDKVVATILFDGSSEWPHFDHPGAMQRLGNVVAIALEAGQSGQPTTKILFFDVTDPEHPAMLNNSFDPPTQKAGVVGITPCATGREGLPCATGHFLMLVSGGDNDELLFFESNGGDLTSPDLQWAPLYTWHKNELVGGDWPAKHQTLHFIREANAGGRLFLAGARAVGTVEGLYGDDYIDLFEVGFDGSRVVLTQQSTRHMISHPGGEGLYRDGEVLYGGRLASFAAASGFHVTPTGELLFYATEHDNDGPQGTNGRATVKMGEWRHIDMFRPDSPALAPTITAPTSIAVDEGHITNITATAGPPIARPWIELFESTGSQGRYVTIDQLDRSKDNFDDFSELDRATLLDFFTRFNDRAASWRWFAPVTCTIRANDDPFGETGFPGSRTRTLAGTGSVTVVDDLHNVLNNAGNADMFRTVSSAQLTSCTNYYSANMTPRWDLDFDGTTETVSNSAVVSATQLDGPSTLELKVQAQHPIDGRLATTIIPVTIRNVSPVITAVMLSVGPGRRLGTDVPFAIANRPVTASATFTDAGRLDHQTALIEWGDGSVSQSFVAFTDAFGGAEGQLDARHTYATAGVYTVRLSIIDDDGGVGQTTATITVVTPSQAVSRAIGVLDSLIASASEPARSRLVAARTALVAAGRTAGATGALSIGASQFLASTSAQLSAIVASGGSSNVEAVVMLKTVVAEILATIGA